MIDSFDPFVHFKKAWSVTLIASIYYTSLSYVANSFTRSPVIIIIVICLPQIKARSNDDNNLKSRIQKHFVHCHVKNIKRGGIKLQAK